MNTIGQALAEFLRREEIVLRNEPSSLLITDHPLELLREWKGSVLTADRRVRHARVLTELPAHFSTNETVVCLSALSEIARFQVDTALAVTNGQIIAIAENRRGAERLVSLIGKEQHPELESLTRSHCRAVITEHSTLANTALTGAAAPNSPQPALQPHSVSGWENIVAYPGVFSSERADRGSELLRGCALARARDNAKLQSVLDLGCGCGILGISVLEVATQAQVDFVDVDLRALESTRLNLAARKLPTDKTFWLDATGEKLPRSAYDLVLLNPPFHAHGQEQRELGRKMIEIALLVTGGELLVVGNTHLGYGTFFRERSLASAEICTENGFTVWSARGRLGKPQQGNQP